MSMHSAYHAGLTHILCSGPDEGQVQRAKVLTEDLLEVVRQEHAKVKTIVQQQQMELHQAQMQYAAYSYAVCILCSFNSICRVRSFRRNDFRYIDSILAYVRACTATVWIADIVML